MNNKLSKVFVLALSAGLCVGLINAGYWGDFTSWIQKTRVGKFFGDAVKPAWERIPTKYKVGAAVVGGTTLIGLGAGGFLRYKRKQKQKRKKKVKIIFEAFIKKIIKNKDGIANKDIDYYFNNFNEKTINLKAEKTDEGILIVVESHSICYLKYDLSGIPKEIDEELYFSNDGVKKYFGISGNEFIVIINNLLQKINNETASAIQPKVFSKDEEKDEEEEEGEYAPSMENFQEEVKKKFKAIIRRCIGEVTFRVINPSLTETVSRGESNNAYSFQLKKSEDVKSIEDNIKQYSFSMLVTHNKTEQKLFNCILKTKGVTLKTFKIEFFEDEEVDTMLGQLLGKNWKLSLQEIEEENDPTLRHVNKAIKWVKEKIKKVEIWGEEIEKSFKQVRAVVILEKEEDYDYKVKIFLFGQKVPNVVYKVKNLVLTIESNNLDDIDERVAAKLQEWKNL